MFRASTHLFLFLFLSKKQIIVFKRKNK